MSVQDRIESLKYKHAELENAIQSEVARPQPDDKLIHDLKVKKLRVKDEMTNLVPH